MNKFLSAGWAIAPTASTNVAHADDHLSIKNRHRPSEKAPREGRPTRSWQRQVGIPPEIVFYLATVAEFDQDFGVAVISSANKVARIMLRYRFSVKFIGRHSSGMPGPLLNIEN